MWQPAIRRKVVAWKRNIKAVWTESTISYHQRELSLFWQVRNGTKWIHDDLSITRQWLFSLVVAGWNGPMITFHQRPIVTVMTLPRHSQRVLQLCSHGVCMFWRDDRWVRIPLCICLFFWLLFFLLFFFMMMMMMVIIFYFYFFNYYYYYLNCINYIYLFIYLFIHSFIHSF